MKLYNILKSFTGNQTGYGPTEAFIEGTQAELSDSLAEVVLKEGYVEAVSIHETKVTAPAETKPAAKRAKK